MVVLASGTENKDPTTPAAPSSIRTVAKPKASSGMAVEGINVSQAASVAKRTSEMSSANKSRSDSSTVL